MPSSSWFTGAALVWPLEELQLFQHIKSNTLSTAWCPFHKIWSPSRPNWSKQDDELQFKVHKRPTDVTVTTALFRPTKVASITPDFVCVCVAALQLCILQPSKISPGVSPLWNPLICLSCRMSHCSIGKVKCKYETHFVGSIKIIKL